MTADTRKWKPKLLASSLPLEYEVAKILAASGFSANPDYSFHRNTEGRDVEWSVDVRAIRDAGQVPGAKRGCPLDVLIECKHRTRTAAWLFVPDPGRYADVTQHDFVRGVADFSSWFLPDLEWWTSPVPFPVCYKGVEIDLATGHVEAAELRHAFSQLQFAIPPLLRSRVDVPATSFGIIDNTPLLFTAVLVTNSPLFVADAGFSSARVESADEVSHLGREVDCLIVRVPTGQDFFHHVARHFASLSDTVARKQIQADENRKAQGVHSYDLPSSLAKRLSVAGDELTAITDVSCIAVTRVAYLPTLLQYITRIAGRVANNSTREMPPHWRP